MASEENKGYDPATIRDYAARMKADGRPYLLDKDDENTDEYVHFYFVGKYEGREVIYDAVIYTLRLHHESELYEIAEHRAAIHFPDYTRWYFTRTKAFDGSFPGIIFHFFFNLSLIITFGQFNFNKTFGVVLFVQCNFQN